MPKTRIIILLGIAVALLPLLGFPRAWESFFQIGAGCAIVITSVWSTIDRKLTLKAKAQMRSARKKVDTIPVVEAIVPEVTPSFGKRVTDFYPKTGQPGRRATDFDVINPDNQGS